MKKKKINNRRTHKIEDKDNKNEISRNTDLKDVSTLKKSVAVGLALVFIAMSIFAPVIV